MFTSGKINNYKIKYQYILTRNNDYIPRIIIRKCYDIHNPQIALLTIHS